MVKITRHKERYLSLKIDNSRRKTYFRSMYIHILQRHLQMTIRKHIDPFRNKVVKTFNKSDSSLKINGIFFGKSRNFYNEMTKDRTEQDCTLETNKQGDI